MTLEKLQKLLLPGRRVPSNREQYLGQISLECHQCQAPFLSGQDKSQMDGSRELLMKTKTLPNIETYGT